MSDPRADPAAIDEFMNRLLTYGDARDALDKKSDAEVADLLIEHVASDEVPYTPRDALFDNVIDRLQRSKAGAVDRHDCPRCGGSGGRGQPAANGPCTSCKGSGEEAL